MKNFPFLFILTLLVSPAFSQKIIDKKLSWSQGQIVNLHLKFGDSIRVRYWDKAEVSVRIAVTINSGKLNDALLVTSSNTAEEVILKTNLDDEMIKQGKQEDCAAEKSTSINKRNGDGARYFVCSEINYQVFLPRQAKLKLETINGNIDIDGAVAGVFAKTISGYVDMNWPKTKGANLAMKTITGEVYSDLNIDFKNKKDKNPIVGYLLQGAVNGGGPEVHLESISNNVYLRKRD
jgi:hypothetical protein